jgi:hypothetical protein
LQNSDKRTAISWLRCRIVDQPSGFGGPSLVELIETGEKVVDQKENCGEAKIEGKPAKKLPNELRFGRLDPTQKRQINICLFGIDPASTTTAKETQVIFKISIFVFRMSLGSCPKTSTRSHYYDRDRCSSIANN